MIEVNRFDLFPTSMLSFSVPENIAKDWETKLKEVIEEHWQPERVPIHRQTDSKLHLNPKSKKFVQWIEHCLDNVAKEFNYNLSTGQIQGMWATRLRKYGDHPVHSHPDSVLSGVYYVNELTEGVGSLYFIDPRPAAHVVTNFSTDPNPASKQQFMVTPQQGTLYIFPSWLWHGVTQNLSDSERISISFDFRI